MKGVGLSSDSTPVLSLPAGTPAAEKAKVAAEVPAGVSATVKVSQFATGEAEKIENVITAGGWNSDAKKYGAGVSYDAEKDKVVFDTDAPASATKALLDSYPGKIEVRHARFQPQADRFHDSAPFFGAGSLKGSWGGGVCTAGIAIQFGGHEYMTTAGHCYGNGEGVKTPAGTRFGAVDFRDLDLDIELIGDQDYSRHFWTGGTSTSQSQRSADSVPAPYNGLMVCVSGQTTFNHCGHKVTQSNYGFTVPGGRISSNDGFVYNRGGTDACHCNGSYTAPGDSGAPVYRAIGTTSAAVYGSNSGAIWLPTGPSWAVNQPYMYGSKMIKVLAHYNASIPFN
ncbi:hypothetical protein ACFWPQ_34120 [Streptomyces sp. NPDC058464]|uniref:hypothetical protein n=1 Tax=Streptomyces sp. NPDC058464 TaxID=3346511 RepID=UPI00365B3AFD